MVYDETRQDNNVTNYRGAIYVKIETKLSSLIRKDAIYNEKLIGQWCDWSYTYQDQSDNVRSMTNMRQDNNVIDRTSPLNVENKIELS